MSYTYVTGYEGKVEKGLLIDAQAFADVIYDTCEKYLEERGETLNDVDNLPGNSLLIDDGSVLSKGKLSPDKYKFDISGEEYNFSWEKKPAEVLKVIEDLLDDFVASTYELGGKRRIIYASEAYNIMTEAAWNTLRIYGQSLTFLTLYPTPDNGGVSTDNTPAFKGGPILLEHPAQTPVGAYVSRQSESLRISLTWNLCTKFLKPTNIPTSIITSLTFYGLKSNPVITLDLYRTNNISMNIIAGKIIYANEILDFLDSLFIYNAGYTISSVIDRGFIEDYDVEKKRSSMYSEGFKPFSEGDSYWLGGEASFKTYGYVYPYNHLKAALNNKEDILFGWADHDEKGDESDGTGSGNYYDIRCEIKWNIILPNIFATKILKANIKQEDKLTNIVAESSSGIASKNYICKEDKVVRLIANSSNGKGICWLRKKGSSNFEPILEGPSTATLAIRWKCNAGDELMCTSEGNGMSRIYSEKI